MISHYEQQQYAAALGTLGVYGGHNALVRQYLQSGKTAAELLAGTAGAGKRGRKLTAAQVRQIRVLYASGHVSLRALGKRYAVSSQTIHTLVAGRTYRDVA